MFRPRLLALLAFRSVRCPCSSAGDRAGSHQRVIVSVREQKLMLVQNGAQREDLSGFDLEVRPRRRLGDE